jgi:signal transduction histidine kinase
MRRTATSRTTHFTDTAVQGHRRNNQGGSRTSRLKSVRAQLLAPIIVATIGLAVLGTGQTATATTAARDAQRARTLATTATGTVRFVHELERELAETAALRQRGGKAGLPLVTAQRQRADDAAVAYRRDSQAALRAAPQLASPIQAANDILTQLPLIRETATNTATGPATDAVYRKIAESLLGVADALPAQIADIQLANSARAVAAVAAVEHFSSVQRDQLRTIFVRGTLLPGNLTDVAEVIGAREQREAEFHRVATADEAKIYDDEIRGTDVENAARMSAGALTADQNPAGLKVDGDAWYTAQSNVIRRLNLVGLRVSDELDAKAASVARDAVVRAWGTAVGTATVALLALITAILLAVRTARRLRNLRGAALTVARRDLPEAINSVITGQLPDTTSVSGPSAAAITRTIASSNDEIGQVADAFATVHRTALRLAGEQAELRVDVGRMAEVLARRIRTLITRQLRLLDEFERDETDPEVLARLFALDHIAARLRRNGDNLLVLAGGEPGRPASQAVPITAVMTAAASEIEDFHRVEPGPSDVFVAGPVVGDMVHLLAELLENAATFSPPSSPVRIDAHRSIDGALLRIHDSGIGINEGRLAEINARLDNPTVLSSAAAGTMGLHVVAHLAYRHGIRVQLYATGSGTTALVSLPHHVLSLPSALPAGTWRGDPEPVVPVVVDAVPVSAGPTLSRARPGLNRTSPNGTGQAPWFRPYLSGGDMNAAAPQPPGAWPPRPVAPAPAPARVSSTSVPGYVPAPATRPMPPVDAIPMPAAPVLPNPLPRRVPGEQLPATAHLSSPESPSLPPVPAPRPAAEDDANGVTVGLDPDRIRSRLSAFAEGVSAATRRDGAAPVQRDH